MLAKMWLCLENILLLSAVTSSVLGIYCKENRPSKDGKKAFTEIKGDTVSGNVTFKQDFTGGPVYIKGSIKGLSPGKHGFHIHEKGDMSGGCATTGAHFNPEQLNHGTPDDEHSHRGDLSMIEASSKGVAVIDTHSTRISLSGEFSVIGRAVVVHALPDDYGFGADAESKKTGNAGARVGCGLIVSLED